MFRGRASLDAVRTAETNSGVGSSQLNDPRGAEPEYDVTPDGKRFVVAIPSDEQRPIPVTLLLNWTAALKK
jgi:hypothetical protein